MACHHDCAITSCHAIALRLHLVQDLVPYFIVVEDTRFIMDVSAPEKEESRMIVRPTTGTGSWKGEHTSED